MNRVEIIYLIPYFISLLFSIAILLYTRSKRRAQGAIAYSWVSNATGATICLVILLAEWHNKGALEAQKTFSAEEKLAARK